MRACRRDCQHRQMVQDYIDERMRQEGELESRYREVSVERGEERAVTFKEWICARAGRRAY